MRSLEQLIPKLRQSTEDGKIKWSKHRFSGFICNVGNHVIRIWEWHNDDVDASGVTVHLDDLKDTTLDEILADEYSSKYSEVSALHAAARRSALNVDGAIAELENELDKLN